MEQHVKSLLFKNSESSFTKIGNFTNIISFDSGISEYMSNVKVLRPDSSEISLECDINPDLLKQLTGIDLAIGNDITSSMSFELSSPFQVQKRRHKKKRINKKWAKKYGYITKFKTAKIKDCTIIPNETGIDICGKYMGGQYD